MKEEGEVWQLTHENQVNVCWKCGQSGHVGARCNQPTLTFDALGPDEADGEGGSSGTGAVRSCAHVVRTGSGSDQRQNELQKQEEILKQFKENRIREEEEGTERKIADEKKTAAQAYQSTKAIVDNKIAEADQAAMNAFEATAKAVEATAEVTGGVVEEKNEEQLIDLAASDCEVQEAE